MRARTDPPRMRTVDLHRFVDARAACRQLDDPDLMFPLSELDRRGVADAQRVCGRCWVRGHCLELALRHGETYGVWGGRLFTPSGEQPAEGEPAERAS